MNAQARIELVARRALDDAKAADVSLGWYRAARDYCASLGPVETVAGIVAALSPLNTWEDQLRFTPLVIAAARDKLPLPGPGFSANKRKAVAIASGADPSTVLAGDKVVAFYRCIVTAGETDAVCVDRHAWAIAHGTGADRYLTAKRYRETAAAYVAVAAGLRARDPSDVRLTPANVQALTWVWWRDNPGLRF
jgi:hypothetical protein